MGSYMCSQRVLLGTLFFFFFLKKPQCHMVLHSGFNSFNRVPQGHMHMCLCVYESELRTMMLVYTGA